VTVLIWELGENLVCSEGAKAVEVSPACPDPVLTLVAGTSSDDHAFKFFAFRELKAVLCDDSPAAKDRRRSFFADQKYSPSLWSHFLRESLLTLGRDYQLLLRRGKPLPTPAPPPAAVAPQPSTAADGVVPGSTPIKVVHAGSIFQKSKPSPIKTVVDSLASDGAITKSLETGVEAAKIPELVRSVEAKVIPAVASIPGSTTAPSLSLGQVTRTTRSRVEKAVGDVLGRVVPPGLVAVGRKQVEEWWSGERVDKFARECLRFGEVDGEVVEGRSSPLPFFFAC
jgi:nucleoporin NDC1